MSSQLVWLVTGTSTGLGRDLTLAALKRGDKVIATSRARSLAKLEDLKAQGADILELDVTSPLEQLHEIAKQAIAIHGRIDVLVNNAGYILVGAVEENTPEETLDQFNTNVFAALNVARAFLPYMRERKTGTVVWLGSLGGWRAVPNAALYAATKGVVREISASLHEEISPLGLRSICFDFGYFRTAFLTADHRAPQISRIPDYKPMTDKANAALEAYNGKQPGDPRKGVEIMVDVVRGEGVAAGKEFPTVLALGSDCYNVVKTESERTLARLEEWKEVSKSTDFD
ncbi:putative short-chain dehydrogenases reductases (SDR) family protein [Lyophyllum shimeji]|uniref:Short-chain dehydrogenases reductases (SDR) family protein n=1 Tax=Lyophyllum shimeji TaxID=47721 RepID=A0A9P3PCZ0_LYOSH|nr:putative short-chain dehydrogenases reductases (SDR) family protein [Lyophyllum shimeji]